MVVAGGRPAFAKRRRRPTNSGSSAAAAVGQHASMAPRRLPEIDDTDVFTYPAPLPGVRLIGYRRFPHACPGALHPHRHPGAYELCLITEGTLRWQIGSRSWTLRAGDLFLTLPGEVHGGERGVMDRSGLYWVSFAAEGGEPLLGLSGAQRRNLATRLRACRTRVAPAPALIRPLFARVLAALAVGGTAEERVARAALILLLDESAGALAATALTARPSPPVAAAMTRLSADHPPTLAALAAEVGLCPSRLRERFRTEIGISLRDYRDRERMARAGRLLRTSRASITDIALSCGFASSQAFATAFRRQTGFAPGAWRRDDGRPQPVRDAL